MPLMTQNGLIVLNGTALLRAPCLLELAGWLYKPGGIPTSSPWSKQLP